MPWADIVRATLDRKRANIMMDAVEHACLTMTNNPQSNEYINLSSGMGPILRAFPSSAAMRHAMWLKVEAEARGHMCRCAAAALRDALNEFLAEPVADGLACERWTPELKQALLDHAREVPGPDCPDELDWYDEADERKAEIFARPGMFKELGGMSEAEQLLATSEEFRHGMSYAAALLRETMRNGLPDLQADPGILHIKECCAEEIREFAEGLASGMEEAAGGKWRVGREAV